MSVLVATRGHSPVCTLLTMAFLVLWPRVHGQLLLCFLNKVRDGTTLFRYRTPALCQALGEEQTCT